MHSFVIFERLFEFNCRSLKILILVFNFGCSFWCTLENLLGLCSILLILEIGFEYCTPFIFLVISSINFFCWILFFIFYSKIKACFCKFYFYSFSFFLFAFVLNWSKTFLFYSTACYCNAVCWNTLSKLEFWDSEIEIWRQEILILSFELNSLLF